ncbi:transcription elongation factor subunit Spt4 [Sulfuracidifex metallicus]|uniref:Transcription elongation factor Spt4 n=1 Tax=Sulfuracidifex metallicus DSM 6482 = JCM 9184 TaxID=523847 RepID=A0A6A9QJ87_SULME|nr:transcription elongation factor subunit Spt4 [Sulfuracidifex metallicus]MCY0850546.1 DNA-directed RNA polymerase, subunit E'' [Sulfuracidifex metallicus]MUN28300.1 DNA-binding protein [Sulfuracidifex metallicus DSM 6482 = JCM 9184]WOE51169.1 transcription elongation factor subunit Spt4 [Sulfuracidifex metallicus DSM 6482 = JCM 9184]
MAKREFKACKNCKALTTPDIAKCPVCDGQYFTDEWEGMVIIIDLESDIAKLMGVQKPWKYAISLK